MDLTRDFFEKEMQKAELNAFKALSRYKFSAFGHWASVWVNLNKIGGMKKKSPFSQLVKDAEIKVEVAKEVEEIVEDVLSKIDMEYYVDYEAGTVRMVPAQ